MTGKSVVAREQADRDVDEATAHYLGVLVEQAFFDAYVLVAGN